MKYKFGLLFVLFPVFAIAQTKVSTDSLAKAVLNDLISSWTLGIDSNSNSLDINVYNKFKSLFNLDATIDDDFDVYYQYDSKNKSGSYKIRNINPKAFDVYAHDVALQVKSIIIDSVATPDPDRKGQQNITFTINRRIDFQKTRLYVLPANYAEEVINGRKIKFENKIDSENMAVNLKAKINANPDAVYKFTADNTIRVVMSLIRDTVRIISIRSLKNNIVCTNDAIDHDAIPDEEDSLRNEFGDFTTNGKPDYDLDGVPEGEDKCKNTYGFQKNKGCPFTYFFTKKEFDVFVGLQFNTAAINLPELYQMGYVDAAGNNAIDASQSNKGVLKSPGILPSVHSGGHITWYFGQKKKQTGISLGFTYSGINAEYQLTSPTVYTFKKQYDNSYYYRRQVIDSSMSEGIKYNIFNLPVMFNYRMHVDRNNNAVLNFRAGPSFMVFVNTSDYKATMDIGGLYQIDAATGKIIYEDKFDPASKTNLYLTAAKINAQNPNPGAGNVFNQLGKNYDLADNRVYSGKQHLTRFTVAFNVAADLQYKISEGLTIKAGPHFTYAPLLERKEKYKPLDNTSDEYQSIYKSTAKTSYTAYGLNLGFVYNF